VEARERDHAGAAQPVEQALATVGLVVAGLVADQRRRLYAPRLRGGVLDTVVADHGGREGEQLPGVARIRERFLVARHRRCEHGLADRGAGRAHAHARPGRTVLEVEPDSAHAATAAALCAMRPPASVSRERPCTSRPRNAQLRLRERRSSAVTVQRSRRSQSARSATAPTAIRGAVSPKARAGPAVMRSTISSSGTTPLSTKPSTSAGNAVSSPITPLGAAGNGTSFSAGWCGAWSVA